METYQQILVCISYHRKQGMDKHFHPIFNIDVIIPIHASAEIIWLLSTQGVVNGIDIIL